MDFQERTYLIAAGLMSAYTNILSVVQDAVKSRRKPVREHGAMHTSARLTHRHSFNQADNDDSDNLNSQVHKYYVENRPHFDSVPAIHFPGGKDCQPRVVRIYLYQPNKDDIIEFEMRSLSFHLHKCVSAIHLRDKFDETVDRLDEFHKCNWLGFSVERLPNQGEWTMMLRISEDFEVNYCF